MPVSQVLGHFRNGARVIGVNPFLVCQASREDLCRDDEWNGLVQFRQPARQLDQSGSGEACLAIARIRDEHGLGLRFGLSAAAATNCFSRPLLELPDLIGVLAGSFQNRMSPSSFVPPIPGQNREGSKS